ncbi:MAG: photosynthetic complex assembly protein PuhC [Oceanicaulis sp.]
MSAHEDYAITPGALIAVAALALSCFTVAALSTTDAGPAPGEVRQQRVLSVEDSVQDGMILRDAQTGAELARLEIEGDLFAMTALRSVTGRIGARPETGRFTVLLIEQGDGEGLLQDPETGRVMALTGFGPDNAEALLSLLDP